MTIYSQFQRTDYSDGASEILSLVKFTAGYSGFGVQITTIDGEDFIGVYDTDGDKLDAGCEWELVPADEVPDDLADWAQDWATGCTTVHAVDVDPRAEVSA